MTLANVLLSKKFSAPCSKAPSIEAWIPGIDVLAKNSRLLCLNTKSDFSGSVAIVVDSLSLKYGGSRHQIQH